MHLEPEIVKVTQIAVSLQVFESQARGETRCYSRKSTCYRLNTNSTQLTLQGQNSTEQIAALNWRAADYW